MISASDRENAVLLINEAIASGASCKKACWTVWIVNFNTSHVTVYRKTSVIDAIRYAHFNTSHVTVYPRLLALKRNQNSDFNTSHVTVYLVVVDNNLPKSRKFQYISCYGLSRDNEWILGRYHVFQYISCYGLSLRICSITGICRHFNTSHVTVYLISSRHLLKYASISIHLMLRFILEYYSTPTVLPTFQYISCYGLSLFER